MNDIRCDIRDLLFSIILKRLVIVVLLLIWTIRRRRSLLFSIILKRLVSIVLFLIQGQKLNRRSLLFSIILKPLVSIVLFLIFHYSQTPCKYCPISYIGTIIRRRNRYFSLSRNSSRIFASDTPQYFLLQTSRSSRHYNTHWQLVSIHHVRATSIFLL